MKQHCNIWAIWGTWAGLPALAVFVGLYSHWSGGLVVLVIGVVAQVVYLRTFPGMSRFLGYGSVEDVPAEPVILLDRPSAVSFYTASVCPFCPIVRRRLEALKDEFGFEIVEIDVTFRPRVIREKNIKSVPVVEINGQFLFGNATSAQLSAFLRDAA